MHSQTVKAERTLADDFGPTARSIIAHYYRDVSIEIIGDSIAVSSASVDATQKATDVVTHLLSTYRPTVERTIVPPNPLASGIPLCGCSDRFESLPGFFINGRDWITEIQDILGLLQKHFSDLTGGRHFAVPSVINAEVLAQAGYLNKFPQAVSHIYRLPSDYWQTASASTAVYRSGDESQNLEHGRAALNPVACFHALSKADLFVETPPSTVSIQGSVFRHEGHRHDSSRLGEFSVFELVHFGDASSCTDFFDQLVKSFSAIFSEYGLPIRVATASDAFFGEDALLRRRMQMASGGKIEFRVLLKDNTELSIASVNQHRDYFVRAFDLGTRCNIKETACAAIGLDRLAICLRGLRHDK